MLVWFGWPTLMWPRCFASYYDLPVGASRWARLHTVGVELGPLDLKVVIREG